jgi:hypothetical protein
MSIIDVCYRVAHNSQGGVKALAARMGMSYQVLQNKLNPNNDTHHLTVEQAAEIADMADSDEIAEEFAARRNMVCIPITKHEGASDMELFDLIINMDKEKAEWLTQIQRALLDGVIDPDEFQRIQKESRDHLAAVAEFASRIESIVQERRKVARAG